ncbi:MAG TPA: hypothetical protein VIQ25_03330 [Gemmatimonadales bacterium]
MRPLEDLVIGLLGELSASMVAGEAALEVTALDISLPIEARIGGPGLWVSAPRGVMRTGFVMPHSRMRLRCASA